MDPSLFRIDWEVLSEALVTIVVLSFFVERALALIFEHRLYVDKYQNSGLKEPIAFAFSLVVVYIWKFDVFGIIFHADKTSFWGYLITAAIVAGGSKASIKFFHDILNAKSTALLDAEKVKKAALADTATTKKEAVV